jgi:hypothetical protein
MQSINDFFARKLKTSKEHVHKHGAQIQEHTKVFFTPKRNKFVTMKKVIQTPRNLTKSKCQKKLIKLNKEIITKLSNLLFFIS